MTTTIPVGGTTEYLADKYYRLRNCAEILASDPAMENAAALMIGIVLWVLGAVGRPVGGRKVWF
jgi:hypothetical protein